MNRLSNYPPGVTGNEPQITGDWPCYACGGSGGERDEEGFNSCWMCQGSGIHPEEAPRCPECNSEDTAWFGDTHPAMQALIQAEVRQVNSYDEQNALVCFSCGEVTL